MLDLPFAHLKVDLVQGVPSNVELRITICRIRPIEGERSGSSYLAIRCDSQPELRTRVSDNCKWTQDINMSARLLH